MSQFQRGREVMTSKPFVVVDGLKPGRYRFQLEVMDSAGNLSKPAVLTVSVRPPRREARRRSRRTTR